MLVFEFGTECDLAGMWIYALYSYRIVHPVVLVLATKSNPGHRRQIRDLDGTGFRVLPARNHHGKHIRLFAMEQFLELGPAGDLNCHHVVAVRGLPRA